MSIQAKLSSLSDRWQTKYYKEPQSNNLHSQKLKNLSHLYAGRFFRTISESGKSIQQEWSWGDPEDPNYWYLEKISGNFGRIFRKFRKNYEEILNEL